MDNPKRYGLKREAIPYFGGSVIFLAFFTSVLIFLPLSREVLALLGGMSLLTIVAFLDDAYTLSPKIRLAFQILSALILIVGGVGITHLTNPLGGVFDLTSFDWNVGSLWGGEYHFTLFADCFTIAWVLLLVNSFNWLDGVEGLASGIGGVASLVIFFLAAREGFHYFNQSSVIALSAILSGCAFAFTFFNFPPPRILLGDSGSMLLGFVIASLAIFSGGKVATAALVLGFPLLDAMWVILRRILEGKSPFKGDYTHLHHRLLAFGLNKKQVVLLIYFLSLIFGSIALFIDDSFGKLIALGSLFIVMLGVGWKLRKFKLHKEKEA